MYIPQMLKSTEKNKHSQPEIERCGLSEVESGRRQTSLGYVHGVVA